MYADHIHHTCLPYLAFIVRQTHTSWSPLRQATAAVRSLSRAWVAQNAPFFASFRASQTTAPYCRHAVVRARLAGWGSSIPSLVRSTQNSILLVPRYPKRRLLQAPSVRASRRHEARPLSSPVKTAVLVSVVAGCRAMSVLNPRHPDTIERRKSPLCLAPSPSPIDVCPSRSMLSYATSDPRVHATVLLRVVILATGAPWPNLRKDFRRVPHFTLRIQRPPGPRAARQARARGQRAAPPRTAATRETQRQI